MSKYKRISIIVAILITVSITTYLLIKQFSSPSPKISYQTSVVERGTLVSSISVSGNIAATNSRTVTTTASGVVKKVYVKEGQKVSSGTPIMLIDLDMDGKQKYQSALSSYQNAQNSLNSAQSKIYDLQSALVNSKNIFDNQWANQSPDDPTYIQKHNAYLSAQASYDNQQNVIKQAQLALESARISLQMSGPTVYAPITGTVSAISLTPGMILNPTSTAANSSNSENKIAIVKTDTTPAITVSLTEVDVTKVKVGNKATILLDAFTDKVFTGKVIAVDTAGTVSSGVTSYPTTIQFDSDVAEVLSNMSATAQIILDVKTDVLIVPSSAVQTQNQQSTVTILKENQPQIINVVVGLVSDSQAEIVSGLNEGDVVVIGTQTSTTPKSGQTGSVFGSFSGARGAGGAVRIGR